MHLVSEQSPTAGNRNTGIYQKHPNTQQLHHHCTKKAFFLQITYILIRKKFRFSLPWWSDNKWWWGPVGSTKTKHPKGILSINTIHVYSATAELQRFTQKAEIKSIHLCAQMHFKLHLPHLLRIQWLDIACNGRFLRPALYSNPTLPAEENDL